MSHVLAVPSQPGSAGAGASASASASVSASRRLRPLHTELHHQYLRRRRSCAAASYAAVARSPCSNCRRANIACVLPSTNRPPGWARRIQRLTNNARASNDTDPGVGKVMDRLRTLEGLVKELSGQLEQARVSASTTGVGSSGVNN
ncbi:hypothetical protein V1505DRAFT_47261 [Lipomyces doorenjongii]